MVRKVNPEASPEAAARLMQETAASAPEPKVEAPGVAEPTELKFEPVKSPLCVRCGASGATLYGQTETQRFFHCQLPTCNHLFARGDGDKQKLVALPDMRQCTFAYEDKRLPGLATHHAEGFLGPGEGSFLIPGARERNTSPETADAVLVCEGLARGQKVTVTLQPVVSEPTQSELHAARLAMIATAEAHAVERDKAANAQAQEAMKNGPASAWDKVQGFRRQAENARLEAEDLKKMTDEEAEDVARRKLGMGPRRGLK